MAFLLLLCVGGFVMATFIVGLVWNGVDTYASGVTPLWQAVSSWLRPALNLAINIVAVTLIYRYLPKAEVKWGHALGGAIVAGVGWEIGRQVLSSYVIGQKYSSTME